MGNETGEAAFIRRLAMLNPQVFRRFVCEIYAHRSGHVVVDREGTPVDTAETAGDVDRWLYVHYPDEGDLPDLDSRIDAIVVPGALSEEQRGQTEIPAVVDASELFQVTRYALESGTGDDICRRYLGIGLRPEGADTADTAVDDAPLEGRDRAVSSPIRTPPTERVEGTTDASQDDRSSAFPAVSSTGRPESSSEDADTPRQIRIVAAVGVMMLIGGIILGSTLSPTASDSNDPVSGPPDGVETGSTNPDAPAGTLTVSRLDSRSLSRNAADSIRQRYARIEPTCDRPPNLVIQIQVGALNYDQGTNTGVKTVYRFASPANRRVTRPFDNFNGIVRSGPFDELLDHERAEYGPLLVNGTSARQQVTVTTDDGDTETYLFELSKQTTGEYEGCWMTDSVEPRIPGT